MEKEFIFLSPEWCDEVKKTIKEKTSPEELKNLSISISNTYENCPDGKNKFSFFRYENGKIQEILIGEEETPKADFMITGDYEVLAQISKAKLRTQRAIVERKIKFKGNMFKAMEFSPLVDRQYKIISEINTVY